ncbi:MAG: hypothetical protein QF805_14370, partial [Pirellulaceae bacterium]|nr:hypothetical protein [Pirellulaceae bacterium]
MKAIVICTGAVAGVDRLGEYGRRSLLPLVDRPVVQHVVEQLVRAGVVEYHFVLGHAQQDFQQLLAGGERWGAEFHFHHAEHPDRPYDVFESAELWQDGDQHLLVHADRLPQVDLSFLTTDGGDALVFTSGAGVNEWSGWGRIGADSAAALPAGAMESEVADLLRALPHDSLTSDRTLSAQSFELLLESQAIVVGGGAPDLFMNGRNPRGPGIRICRNVHIDPTAQIEGPVFLGDNVRVGKNVRLGPNTVVGDNSVIDRQTVI